MDIDVRYPSTLEPSLSYLYNSASVSVDVREMIILFSSLKLRLRTPISLDQSLVTAYSVINKQYVRIWELNYKCRINFYILNEWGVKRSGTKSFVESIRNSSDITSKKEIVNNLLSHFFEKKSPVVLGHAWHKHCETLNLHNSIPEINELKLLEFLIVDSIYCLMEIIKSHKVFGPNYVATSYSVLANAYQKAGFWVELLYIYNELHIESVRSSFLENEGVKIDNPRAVELNLIFSSTNNTALSEIQELTGNKDQYLLNSWYHYEMALRHYHGAIELHNEGKTYREMLEGMYYLDDDFNDDILHFTIALERYKINSGTVLKHIKMLENKLSQHKLYKWDSYVKH